MELTQISFQVKSLLTSDPLFLHSLCSSCTKSFGFLLQPVKIFKAHEQYTSKWTGTAVLKANEAFKQKKMRKIYDMRLDTQRNQSTQ